MKNLGCVVVCLLWPVVAWAGPTVLVLGDSLSAGYGLNAGEGWVALLQKRMTAQGYPHTVVNASISGETTAGGLARLPAALARHRPELVLIELGANDGLRGLSLQTMRDNLTRLVQRSREAGAKPLLFEMQIPPNYGVPYSDEFRRSFARVAQAQQAVPVPFFMAAIALKPEFFQDDGIHPNASAQPRLLDAVWPVLKPHLNPGRPRK